VPCWFEALAYPAAWSSWAPLADKLLIGALGLFSNDHLLGSESLDIVGIGWPAPVSLLGRLPCLQFEAALLVGHQCRTPPEVVALLGEQMPTQDSKLAGDRNGGNLMATAGADADEEGAQWTGRFGSCPGRFDQHGAGVAAPHLADATMLRKTKARLANPRIEAKIADEFLWRGETPDIADRGHEASRNSDVDASDGDQPFDCRIAENGGAWSKLNEWLAGRR
jgi:hypothetical protein